MTSLLWMAHPAARTARTSLRAPWKENIVRSIAVATCLLACANVWAAGCEKSSPAHTVALVELYTSEGCNSCPPADRWLSGLASAGFGGDRVVPLGLHVDYWDYIGWKDAFAQARFGDRQRAMSRASGSTFVYTPQVMVQARDFRSWSGTAFDSQVRAINARPAQADIQLAIVPAAGAFRVTAQAQTISKVGAQMFVALTQNRIVTAVKAGENRGESLKHDHVVREWHGPLAFDADGRAKVERTFSVPAGARATDLNAVAIVQNPVNGEVLQTVALAACTG